MTHIRIIGIVTLTLLAALRADAQVSPDIPWRTIRTEHFQVHYSPGLEENARRAAFNAERAYAQLSAELVPPRGPLDLVIADNVDFTNGYATPFPTNRIVIYTHPPVSASSLRFYDEWSALVITHELVHIFQLDRAKGWWGFAQRIFGRSPPLMPNLYTPSWVSEGLAVYYESRLTGSGRLFGSEHRMIARAAAIAGSPRRLDELSLATSRYPGGQSAYAYGSLLFEHLANTRGADGVPKFIERISGAPLPFFLNRAARRSFGVTLEGAWRQYQDSLRRAVGPASDPLPGWRELTGAGREAHFPRWLNDTTLIFAANTGRETAGAYSVDTSGRVRRIGRRNGLEPNDPMTGGGLVFAQLEYRDPYQVRSDLYIEKDGRTRRLTHGARLSSPDVRADGMIVAVQAVPGTTQLVLVSADGRNIAPMTGTATVEVQWSEPRWSPDGRIAAVRRTRDGYSEIVILAEGREPRVVSRSWSVESSPSWSPNGDVLYFTSDRSGSPQIYSVAADAAASLATPQRLSDAATGIAEPEPAASPMLAAVRYDADGWHIGVAPNGSAAGAAAIVDEPVARARPVSGELERDTTPSRPYRPWRTLVPRYWLPIIEESGDDAISYGGITSGADVIGRHGYSASLKVTPESGDLAGGIGYEYSGLGNPVVGASFSQFSDYDALRTSATAPILGWLRERSRVIDLSMTLLRPRIRTGASLTVAAELERVEYSTRPDTLIERINADLSPRDYAAGVIAAGWSNTQRPGLAISPEDGLSISGTARRRWRQNGGAGTTILIGTARAYKSLDLPGFAHHVIAARVAAGWASEHSTTDFGVGGTSGSSVEIVPGFRFGDSPRTFGVRGFPADSRDGIRALGGTVEYRAPLIIPSRGWRLLPLFFDKVSISAFGDAAAAWCPARDPVPVACTGSSTRPDWIASAGGELNLDAALPYDVPYRFRLGVAAPVRLAGLEGIDPVSVYFTLGYSF